MLQSTMQDVRYTFRQWRRAPGFALTVVAVLALGLGANIAVFTLLNGILLRPLPYTHPDRIVSIELGGPMPYYNLTYANMLQLRDAVGPRLKIGAVLNAGSSFASVVGPGGRYQVTHGAVTAGLFDMLGVQPVLGRGFREEENDPGRNRVLLIGDDVWHKVFNADPSVIGKSLAIRREPYTIIGVLPKGFFFWYGDKMSVWSPAAIPPAARSAMSSKDSIGGSLYARLPDGMSAAQLAADLSRTQAVVAKEVTGDQLPTSIKVTGYQQSLIEDGPQAAMASVCVLSSASGRSRASTLPVLCLPARSRVRANMLCALHSAPPAAGSFSKPSLRAFSSASWAQLSACCSVNPPSSCFGARLSEKCRVAQTIHVDWRVILLPR